MEEMGDDVWEVDMEEKGGSVVGGEVRGERPWWKRVLGITLIALSAVIFSLMSLLVKALGSRIPSFELVFMRSIVQLACASACLAWGGTSPWPSHLERSSKISLVLRGVTGVCAMSSIYLALQVLPLGDAQALYLSSALLVGIMARFVIAEPFGGMDCGLATIGLVGVVFVARPEVIFGAGGNGSESGDGISGSGRAMGVAIALVGAVFASGSYITVRVCGPHVSCQVLTFSFAMAGCVISPIAAWAFGQDVVVPQGILEWAAVFGIGLMGFGGQSMFNYGASLESAATAGIVGLLDIVCAFVWQATLLGDPPSVWSVVGTVIIVGAVTVAALLKIRKEDGSAAASYVPLVDVDRVSASTSRDSGESE